MPVEEPSTASTTDASWQRSRSLNEKGGSSSLPVAISAVFPIKPLATQNCAMMHVPVGELVCLALLRKA